MQALGWALAATGPSAPSVDSISPDTGSSSTDHITNAIALAVTGTAEASSTVNIYDGSSQSGTYLGNTTADANGNWTFNTGTLAAGNHSLTATATDGNGTSADSTPLSVTIDVTAPSTPTVALSNDTGSSGSDQVTNDASLTLTGIESGATVEYSLDGGSNWSTSAPTLAQLVQGSNTVEVRQTDLAGNVSSAGSLTFTLDTAGGAGGGAYHRQRQPRHRQHHQCSHADAQRHRERGHGQLRIDGGTNCTSSFPAVGGSTTLSCGRPTWPVTPSDTAFSFTLDTSTAAPGVALTTDSGSSASDHITNVGTLALSGLEAGATVSYSIDGGTTFTSSFSAARGSTTLSCGPPMWPVTPTTPPSPSPSTPARQHPPWR